MDWADIPFNGCACCLVLQGKLNLEVNSGLQYQHNDTVKEYKQHASLAKLAKRQSAGCLLGIEICVWALM